MAAPSKASFRALSLAEIAGWNPAEDMEFLLL
jgi:hypothetical protein